MIESWQIPILTSAIDFLFDVGHVVLEAIKSRREKTNTQSSPPAQSSGSQLPSLPTAPAGSSSPNADAIFTKEQALKSIVQESTFKQREAEIKHLLKLAETYETNYRLASEKYAKWGEALVPPIVVHELIDSEQHLIETLAKLRVTVEAVLGKRVELDEFRFLEGK